jgi:prepilin-type N-terminal cleavage/methylation domain-containing protein
MRRLGVTLVELLIVLALFSILGVAFVALVRTTTQNNRATNEITNLEQNGAVVANLLQSDLRLAGYRGGTNATEFVGGTPENQIQALTWLNTASNWNNINIPTGPPSAPAPKPIETIEVVPSTNAQFSSELRIRYITSINLSAFPVAALTMADVGYRIDLKNNEFERRNVTLTGSVNVTVPAAGANTLTPDGSTYQPVSNGLEALSFFFQTNTGAWQATRPAAAAMGALGIYVRMRSPNPTGPGTDCGTAWPRPSTGTNAGITFSSVGVSNTTYSGTDCNFRRLERVLVIAPSTPIQSW